MDIRLFHKAYFEKNVPKNSQEKWLRPTQDKVCTPFMGIPQNIAQVALEKLIYPRL